MNLIIASNNKHKIEEISAILSGKFEKIKSCGEVGIVCDPEENGATFFDNALIKAKAVSALCEKKFGHYGATRYDDFAVLADDTGLCVDALDGAPGVRSARYAEAETGTVHNDAANRQKLLRELQNAASRKAHFECTVVLLFGSGKMIWATGRIDGYITRKEHGSNGFGYDSLFFADELGKTFAEATPKEKNAVSHRGRALKNLLEQI